MMAENDSKITTLTSSFKQSNVITMSLQKENLLVADTGQSNHTSSYHTRSCIVENFIVVWLESNIRQMDSDAQNSMTRIRRIVNSIKIFTDSYQCIDYLTKVKDERVFLIISELFEQHVVPLITDLAQIASIYIFCDDKLKHKQCAQQCRKVKGIFDQIEHICDALKCDVRQFEKNLTPISIVPSSSTTDLNEIDPSFIYSKLLKEIVLKSGSDKKDKKEFVDFCRVFYRNNNQELKIIDEFKRHYARISLIWKRAHATPVWWYSRKCFLYAMLNKALRIQDVEVIIKMGFFIRDLHRQIEQLHSKLKNHHLLTVYHGQGMLHSDFEKLQKSIGGFLSFNNFLSTNTNRAVSLGFARNARENTDLTAILFRMEINPSISTSPFISLDNISYFTDATKNILFSMHTVFRIDEITLIEDRLWQVNLTSSDENDEQLILLTQQIREATQASTGLQRLAKLMYHMGESFKAEEIYTTLLKTRSDEDRQQLALSHHQLGYTFEKKNDLSSALSHYQQSLDIYLTYQSSDDSRLSRIYTDIGQVLRKQGNLKGALENFQSALNSGLQAPEYDHVKIATRYSNIGGVLKDEGNYSEALKSYVRALEIYLVHLPPHHPFLAITYSNIGLMYNLMEDHASALSYYKKTLEIHERSLPLDHPSLTLTRHNMAYALDDFNRTQAAIQHSVRAIDTACSALGPNHPPVQQNERDLDEGKGEN
jgi:tetratricopeptide (TPR) repeat protein